MNYSGKRGEDGSVEATVVITPSDVNQLRAAAIAADLGGLMELRESLQWWNPFRRKAKYCITCGAGD
jgi:hypothetical protein